MHALKFAAAAAILVGLTSVGSGEDKNVAGPLDVKVKAIDGKDLDLGQYKGKVVLIVNVASKCGYTKQYEGLQDLYSKYGKDGLIILGVPSNDFGKQEPGTEEDIQKFCASKYSVTFPMTSKVVVKGEEKVPLYKILTAATADQAGKVTEVGWNFEKFLVDRHGKVVGRYKSAVAPESDELINAIKTQLDKK